MEEAKKYMKAAIAQAKRAYRLGEVPIGCVIVYDGKIIGRGYNLSLIHIYMFGVDAVRYFVLHEMPFENDGVITWELMVERMNSDLANTLGNLVNRTISMSNKYFDGVVRNAGVSEPVDEELKSVVLAAPKKAAERMEELRVADAISEIFTLFKRCNKYIDETMPWALAKEEDKKERLETVLYNLVESISIGASLLYAFMPETSERDVYKRQLNARIAQQDVTDLVCCGQNKKCFKQI